MKYTARDESRVANIARGEAECYICHKTLIISCILSYKQSGSILSVLSRLTVVSHENKEEVPCEGLSTNACEYFTRTNLVKIKNAITGEPSTLALYNSR